MGKRPRADKNKRKRDNVDDFQRAGRQRVLTNKVGKGDATGSKGTGDDEPAGGAAASGKRGVSGAIVPASTGKTVPLSFDVDFVELTEGRLKARLLYTNPVCLLTTVVPPGIRERLPAGPSDDKGAEADADGEQFSSGRNVMVLSWCASNFGIALRRFLAAVCCEPPSLPGALTRMLCRLTPINNEGGFVCAMHKRRFSSACVLERQHFVLSVPVAGMEDTLVAVGSNTGRRADKFAGPGAIPGLAVVELGSSAPAVGGKRDDTEGNPFTMLEGREGADAGSAAVVPGVLAWDQEAAVAGCVAQLECRVVSVGEADDKHHLVSGQILRAFVHPRYWNGKHLHPAEEGLPATLTFLGASRFAHMR